MRNINEFNIPVGNSHGYEILYFGVNLILMRDYRLAFDVEVKNSDNQIEVLIISRKDVLAWKEDIIIIIIIMEILKLACTTAGAM